jgi:hypothetical protein
MRFLDGGLGPDIQFQYVGITLEPVGKFVLGTKNLRNNLARSLRIGMDKGESAIPAKSVEKAGMAYDHTLIAISFTFHP